MNQIKEFKVEVRKGKEKIKILLKGMLGWVFGPYSEFTRAWIMYDPRVYIGTENSFFIPLITLYQSCTTINCNLVLRSKGVRACTTVIYCMCVYRYRDEPGLESYITPSHGDSVMGNLCN